jgi:hypothetical protein
MEKVRFGKWRIVHAKRARKLRKRGEDVRFYGTSMFGHSLYTWLMQ